MKIDKDQIVGHLKDQGDTAKAQQAEKDLPQQVDPEEDAGMLQKLGIEPKDLLSTFGGNIAGLS